MQKRIILFFFVLLTGLGTIQAQENWNVSRVDSETYSLFQAKDWEGLIQVGREALNRQIDFYYLRVRVGIAFFEKGNYREAALHFEKAREVNQEEEYVKEYLYYSYLWSGKEEEAELLVSVFSSELKRKTQTYRRGSLRGLDFAYNYTGSLDPQIINEFSGPADVEAIGYQYIPRFHHYGFFGVGLQLSPRWTLYQGLSYLQATQFYYSQENGLSLQTPTNGSTSWQYVASAGYYIGKGWSASFGGHLLQLAYDVPFIQSVGNSPQTQVETDRVQAFDWLVFGALSKRLNYLDLGVNLYMGKINSGNQLQTDFQLSFFPMGNLNLYTYSVLSYQNQGFDGVASTNRIIFNQEIGLKLTHFLWLEGYGTFGELQNYISKQGIVVFNRLDQIDQRWGGRLLLVPNPSWKLTLDFTNFSNSSRFQANPAISDQNLKTYSIQSLTAILSWKF
ncbi:MAG: hypothetical protein HWE15_00050 [Algoriphagus sp.]|uniref:tetratricopeptide repeat protein n=1 Tax=Algoriphagus sp. TaxID=1872435 RepID=UPI0017B77CD8|nr:hypothetical protein [Algoriphagus sp.]NVJ84663.1 hypothetical protein [Algoriphagus sp.]